MSKQSKSTGKGKALGKTPAKTPMYNDRNLMGVNPTKEQFEPTDASPIRQRNKMGGGSC